MNDIIFIGVVVVADLNCLPNLATPPSTTAVVKYNCR